MGRNGARYSAVFLACAVLWTAAPQAAETPLVDAGPAQQAESAAAPIRRVEFEGNRTFPNDELQALAAPLIGRPAVASEIEALRHRISRYYADRGLINSGAVYPDDHLRDGVLRFRIIEGRVTELRVAGNERLKPAYFNDRLVEPDEALNMNVLQERFQMLMADPLLARLNARVLPGERLGEAVLDLQVDRATPWQASVFANNHRAPSTGETALGVAGLVRNLTGFGDVFDATLQSTRGAAKGGFGWSIPFGLRLPQLSVRYERGDSSVIEEPLDRADVRSTVTARELTLTQPVWVSLREQFLLSLSRSLRENSTTIMGEPFSFVPGESSGTSRVRSWRFAQEYMARNDSQVLALRSTFVSGRSNTLDEPELSPVPYPAQHYRLWLGQAQFSWKPGAGGPSDQAARLGQRLAARLDVQSTRDRLVSLEKFAAGGAATVRGYRENTLVRDNGYAGSLEYHFSNLSSAVPGLEVFPFLDFGAAWNQGEARESLRSLGLGASWQISGLRTDLAWGHRLKSRPDAEHRVIQDHGVHFALSYAFP